MSFSRCVPGACSAAGGFASALRGMGPRLTLLGALAASSASGALGALGCVTQPEDQPVALSAGSWETVSSEQGLVIARLSLESEQLSSQDPNYVLVELHSLGGSGEPTLRAADLFMPAHGHQGAEEPVVEALDGRYRVYFVFLMPGRWELGFDLEVEGVADRVEVPVEVP